MYEQSTSININQLIRNHGKNAPGTFDSRSHLLPQGGYTGGGGTLMAPSKTIARRPGQHKLGKLAPGGIWWNWWNKVEHYPTIRQFAMHVTCMFVCIAALAPRSGQIPHTLEASCQMSTNHACKDS